MLDQAPTLYSALADRGGKRAFRPSDLQVLIWLIRCGAPRRRSRFVVPRFKMSEEPGSVGCFVPNNMHTLKMCIDETSYQACNSLRKIPANTDTTGK